MDNRKFWDCEREFWLKGEAHFRRMMTPDCVMVFPDPVGIVAGETIIETLRSAPRWQSVEMSGQVLRRAGDNAVVLAYRAEGRREGGDPYRTLCSSTYLKSGPDWRLAQHQHTPIPS